MDKWLKRIKPVDISVDLEWTVLKTKDLNVEVTADALIEELSESIFVETRTEMSAPIMVPIGTETNVTPFVMKKVELTGTAEATPITTEYDAMALRKLAEISDIDDITKVSGL